MAQRGRPSRATLARRQEADAAIGEQAHTARWLAFWQQYAAHTPREAWLAREGVGLYTRLRAWQRRAQPLLEREAGWREAA